MVEEVLGLVTDTALIGAVRRSTAAARPDGREGCTPARVRIQAAGKLPKATLVS